MLNLYIEREIIDKEGFIFDRIKSVGGETIIIVPDQYTFSAEKKALQNQSADCLWNTEVISMNRLLQRILRQKGLEATPYIDKYGRIMLINSIIKSLRNNFEVYKSASYKLSFVTMIEDFLIQLKQNDLEIKDIRNLINDETDDLLESKLNEICMILDEYENKKSDGIIDSEDYTSLSIDIIKDSEFLRNKNIWIYEYDSISPKYIKAIVKMSLIAKSVNVLINQNDVGLDKHLIAGFSRICGEMDCEFSMENIAYSYLKEKNYAIRKIEANLFADRNIDAKEAEKQISDLEGLTIVKSVNQYTEIESAASYVSMLIRDKGYNPSEIQIIANDEERIHPLIRRTFDEYNLPIFIDSSRKIIDSIAAAFIVNLLQFVNSKHNSRFAIELLKTKLCDTDDETVWILDNYIRRYRIIGSMWNNDFKYGKDSIGSEKFAAINELRSALMNKVHKLNDIVNESYNVGSFVASFKAYLIDEWRLADRIIDLTDKQNEDGYTEEAQKNLQGYDACIDILSQVDAIMAEDELNLQEFIDIYTTGLQSFEIGIIPQKGDTISVGTLIRTRPVEPRAVVIIGANEGILPLEPSTDGLFSIDEKLYFSANNFVPVQLDEIKLKEEKAAIYRIVSKPSEELYISYAMADLDGQELRPSELVERVKTVFPNLNIRGDIVGEVNSPAEALRHVVINLRTKSASELSDVDIGVLRWFYKNRRSTYDAVMDSLAYKNDPDALGCEIATKIFSYDGKNIKLSASSINSYFECPFKYYVEKGLKPIEEREFYSDPRSIGDIYHRFVMEAAKKILDGEDYAKLASSGDDEEVYEIVSNILDSIATQYNEGLYISSGYGEFIIDRIKEICTEALRAIAEQLNSPSLESADFETKFGRGCKLPPIEMKIDGACVYVEGTIDRADYIDVADEKRIRIIDYKTGTSIDKPDFARMKQGYKMQLMIYMMSAISSGYKPAGMFYIHLNDKEKKDEKAETRFKLDGAYVDEPGVLESMPQESLKRSKVKFSSEEFENLRQEVGRKMRDVATGIVEGDIGIHPLRKSSKQDDKVCKYCNFRSICRKDSQYIKNYERRLN